MSEGRTPQRASKTLNRELSERQIAEIIAEHSGEASAQDIGRKHGISFERVRAIWREAKLPRRNRGSM